MKDVAKGGRRNNGRVRRRLRPRQLVLLAVLLAPVSLGLVWVRGVLEIGRHHEIPPHEPLAIPLDSASLARGRHIAQAIGTCTLCHGPDLGGAVYMDRGPFGIAAGPNLTSGAGGIGAHMEDEDWVRAIRYGVRDDATSLLIMPSEVYVHLSDQDLAALIGYLKRLPPVAREVPRSELRWLGELLTGAGRLNLLTASKTAPLISVPAATPGANAEYGRYLVEAAGCAGCHGYGLSGGKVAGPRGLPPASNLTPAGALATWTEQDFVRAMRKGVRPDGARIDEFMPWRSYRSMNDLELRALWAYLRSVPAKQFGYK